MHQFIRQQGSVVQHLLHGLDGCRIGGPFVMQPDDDADQPLPAERNQDARANHRRNSTHRIGEGSVERNGQRNVAVGRHRI